MAKNVAVEDLPGRLASMGMPDIHWGYGFPIGGVAGFAVKDGIISPGGVGGCPAGDTWIRKSLS